MRKQLLISLVTLCSLTIMSCSDEMNLNIPDPGDLIVVDGWIENGQYAKVLLTRNSPYFSSIDSASMRALVLTRAKVTLTDGIQTETLILRKNEDYFPPYIFEGNEIIGEIGKIYTLTADYGGKTVTASTTIPSSVMLDTAYFKLETGSDSLGAIFLEFTDPPEERNFYRMLTKRKTKDPRYYSTMVMALDDGLFSGEKVGFSITRGPESILSSYGREYFKIGDTVSIKFCTIDKPHYDFWNSFQNEAFNSSNPFASSLSKINTNIQGDGLGIWGGYGVSYFNLIIK